MNIQQLNQINNTVSQNHNVRLLKEGGSVAVKILSNLGNNKYEASVAGVRVQVTASSQLKSGTVFKALVASENGTIKLTPLLEQTALKVETLVIEEALGDLFSAVENQNLAGLLASFGMVQNRLSLSIFQQMKQLGLKISPELMKKIYKDSLKFKGKEKKAAELMVLLKQKGIDYTEEDIISLLLEMENRNDNQNDQKDNLGTGLEISGKNIVEAFIKNIITSDFSDREVGVLTIMNHLGWKQDRSGNGSWVYLPFEIIDYSKNDIKGKGSIKLLLDQGKKMKKVLLDCNYEASEYMFNLDKNGNNYKLLFNVDNGDGSAINIESLKKKLAEEVGKNQIEIEWSEKEKLSGFASGMEEIIFAKGDI